MENQPAYDPHYRRIDRKFNRAKRASKAWIKQKAHAIFWRTLFFFGIGWKYSKFMCRIGKYRKFPDGRCMYCGFTH